MMCLELTCGYCIGSLALLSDGVHQLSDVALYSGLLLSVFLSGGPGKVGAYSFGYHRAQVLGALVALLMQYFSTGILVAKAVARLAGQQHPVDGKVICGVSCITLVVNLVLVCTMPMHGHGHSHGDGASHGESSAANVARLHMLGDLFQAFFCVVVGALIWVVPSCTWADSLTTFVYAGIVVLSTYRIVQELVSVLMEATPPELKADTMFAELSRIKGVIDIHCCHAWVIAPQKVAVSAHLHIEDDHHEEVLHSAQILLKHKYGIIHSTLQISEDEDLA